MELIKEHNVLPIFKLESGEGQMLGPDDFKEKKALVLVFFDTDCVPCNDFLDDIAARYDEYKAENAEVLAIGEGSIDKVREIANARSLPFPVLADTDGHVMRMFAETVPAIIVADRFGEVRFTRSVKEDGDHFLDQEFILNQIDLTELECPECGVPTWPQ
jgi:peroxiredoxin